MNDLSGNTKATKDDWLQAALETLISDGIEQVKILTLANKLKVSRSSFYWYFKGRKDLLDALLQHWLDTNTKAVVTHAKMPAATIHEAVCNIFAAFIDPAQFDTKLDFAIRDWGRRSTEVRRILDHSDATRIQSIAEMFARHDYAPRESLARARTVYYMQIGYNDADLQEPPEDRLALLDCYLLSFTGQPPRSADIDASRARLKALLSS
ncbi:MAG: TetR/AcrR family transcriptional regulator [Pseudomonadota bacterium]